MRPPSIPASAPPGMCLPGLPKKPVRSTAAISSARMRHQFICTKVFIRSGFACPCLENRNISRLTPVIADTTQTQPPSEPGPPNKFAHREMRPVDISGETPMPAGPRRAKAATPHHRYPQGSVASQRSARPVDRDCLERVLAALSLWVDSVVLPAIDLTPVKIQIFVFVNQ